MIELDHAPRPNEYPPDAVGLICGDGVWLIVQRGEEHLLPGHAPSPELVQALTDLEATRASLPDALTLLVVLEAVVEAVNVRLRAVGLDPVPCVCSLLSETDRAAAEAACALRARVKALAGE